MFKWEGANLNLSQDNLLTEANFSLSQDNFFMKTNLNLSQDNSLTETQSQIDADEENNEEDGDKTESNDYSVWSSDHSFQCVILDKEHVIKNEQT